ncbi:E3 ubiquitin-protein ligase MBR1-like [Mercurialis annua]|uniref:E3 ubiquitin-protein ligase MBR1-like n=1 Tax=Mercurialis annua TaxID=3986 RepID=UPI00215FD40C|nr:E3 ubiquitin-protein ligase MBR1-like [Mercurialis annua]
MSTTMSQNYNVCVSASFAMDSNSSSTSNFSIDLKVTSSYVSDATVSADKSYRTRRLFDRQSEIQSSCAEKSFLIPCRSLLSDDAGSFFSKMITDMNVPFSLDNLQWKTIPIYGSVSLANEDELIRKIISSVRSVVTSNSTSDQRNKLKFLLSIEKKIVIPHQEYQAMANARERELLGQRVYAAVGRIIRRPILGNLRRLTEGSAYRSSELLRAIRESSEQAESKQIPASQSSIEALEEVIRDGNDLTTKCSICLEDLVIGSRVTRMPCNHEFHKACIQAWLGTAHACPLCRSKLPTM